MLYSLLNWFKSKYYQFLRFIFDEKDPIDSVDKFDRVTLTTPAIFSFSNSNKASHPGYASLDVFNAYKDFVKKTSDKAVLLLKHVAWGEQEQAKQLITENPELLKEKRNVIDRSGRIFNNISPLAYALWALDMPMVSMLQKHLDSKIIQEQIKEHNSKKSLPGYVIAHGRKYNNQLLLDTYDRYTDLYNKSGVSEFGDRIIIFFWERIHLQLNKLTKFWRDVGKAQKQLPVHFINEMLRKEAFTHRQYDSDKGMYNYIDRDLKDLSLPRETSIRIDEDVMSEKSGLGDKYALGKKYSESKFVVSANGLQREVTEHDSPYRIRGYHFKYMGLYGANENLAKLNKANLTSLYDVRADQVADFIDKHADKSNITKNMGKC